jgi:hypothetical protein
LDAVQHNVSGLASEKGLFREASALYELGIFDRCQEKLHRLLGSYPNNKNAALVLKRVEARLLEQQSGKYDFRQLYKQAKQRPPLMDCATYSSAVEVRESPGRGRGLFTTRKVRAGELLLCEKAFAYSFEAADTEADHSQTLRSFGVQELDVDCTARLVAQITQKLYHDPQSSAAFADLYHGDFRTAPVSEVDGLPVVDS